MSGDSDPDAELKVELCTQLADIINEREPGFWPNADVIRDQLLAELRRELLWDQPKLAELRKGQDELFKLMSTSAFGKLIVFGQPIDELVKDSRHRRRITNAAIAVAVEFEKYTAELKARPYVTVEAMVNHFSREAERSFQARHGAFIRICFWCFCVLVAIWLLVALTPMTWLVGLWASLGVPVGGWWAIRHFDPNDHR